FVYPNMGDGGCASGAAMLVFDQAVMQAAPFDNVYYGPEYSEAEIEAALRRANLQYEHHDEIEDRVGQLLKENCTCGRFYGAMGMRAAGGGKSPGALPRRRSGSESVAEPSARADRVYAVRPGGAGERSAPALQERPRVREDGRVHDHHVRLHGAADSPMPGRR